MRSDAEIWPDPGSRPSPAVRAEIRRIAGELEHDEIVQRGGAQFGWYGKFYVAEELYRKNQNREVREQSELARLRAEVTALRDELSALKKRSDKNIKTINDSFVCLLDVLFSKEGAKKKGILNRAFDRLQALEQRPAESVTLPSANDIAAATRSGPAMHDAGIWTSEKWYQPGDLVTCSNASWLATIKSRGQKPGEGAAFRLIHKTETAHVRRMVREELAGRAGKGAR
jgi:hypothetical protein